MRNLIRNFFTVLWGSTHLLSNPYRKSIRHAFSLIELLVVITIISVLAAFLLPALEEAVAASRRISCQSNLQQQYIGLLQYLDEFDGSAPPYWRNPNLTYEGFLTRTGILEASKDEEQQTIFVCPDLIPADFDNKWSVPEYICHYTMNMYISGYKGTNSGWTAATVQVYETNKPSLRLFLAETHIQRYAGQLYVGCGFYQSVPEIYTNRLFKIGGYHEGSVDVEASFYDYWHNWSPNGLYCDGHTETRIAPWQPR